MGHKNNKWKPKENGTRTNLAYTIKKLKWSYAGHLAREKRYRWAVKVPNWMPSKDTWRKGRPATKWTDELVNECKRQKEQGKPETHWQHRARDKMKWKAGGEAYAQRWAGMGLQNDVVASTNAVLKKKKVENSIRSIFPFQYIIIFQIWQSFEPSSSTLGEDRHVPPLSFL